MRFLVMTLAIVLVVAPAKAKQVDNAAPVQAVQVAPEPEVYLPAGTEIPLKMTQTITTKGDSWEEGDQFNLVVAADVRLEANLPVALPKGATLAPTPVPAVPAQPVQAVQVAPRTEGSDNSETDQQ